MRFVRKVGVAVMVAALLGGGAPLAFADVLPAQQQDCYRQISVTNGGGFLIRWTARIQTPGGAAVSGATTDNYAVGGTRTLSFTSYGLVEGQRIWPRVKAVAGETEAGNGVRYCRDGGTAAYKATGTTFNLKVDLLN